MNGFILYAAKNGSRRYQVKACVPILPSECTLPLASALQSVDLLMLRSPRSYRKGVIINPTKVMRSMIAQKAAA